MKIEAHFAFRLLLFCLLLFCLFVLGGESIGGIVGSSSSFSIVCVFVCVLLFVCCCSFF